MDDLMSAFGVPPPSPSFNLPATVRQPSSTWKSAGDAPENIDSTRKRLMAQNVRRKLVQFRNAFAVSEQANPWAHAMEQVMGNTNVAVAAANTCQALMANVPYLHDDCSVWSDTFAAGHKADDVEFGPWVQAEPICNAAETVIGDGASTVNAVCTVEADRGPFDENPWDSGSAPQKQQPQFSSQNLLELSPSRKSLSRDEEVARYTSTTSASSGTSLYDDPCKASADYGLAVQMLGPNIPRIGVRASTRSRNPQLSAERAGQTKQVTVPVRDIALRDGSRNAHAGQRLHSAKSNDRPSCTSVRASAQSRNIQPGSDWVGNARLATIANSIQDLHDSPWIPTNQSQSQRTRPVSEGFQAPP